MLEEVSWALPPDVGRVFGPSATRESIAAALTPNFPGLVVRPDDFLLLDNKAGHDAEARVSVSALGVLSHPDTGETKGYFARTFYLDRQGDKRDYFDWICTDPESADAHGLGRALYSQLDAFASAWGSQRTSATAAWLGRYVWPTRGYDFADRETLELARSHFSAFAQHHQLRDDELVFARHDGTVEPFDAAKLERAVDFAELKSTERQITLPMWIAESEVKSLTLDVGRAFLLCDPRDPELGHMCMPEYPITRDK